MMDQKQRTAMQRILAREALAKLRAVSELFGVDALAQGGHSQQKDLLDWDHRIDELERWIWDESPIV